MQALIGKQNGRVYHGASYSALQKTRPIYAFIPEEFMSETGFKKHRYLASRWPSINAGANPYAIGSHVLPDATKPVSPRSRCPMLREFLIQIKTIAAVKTIQPTA